MTDKTQYCELCEAAQREINRLESVVYALNCESTSKTREIAELNAEIWWLCKIAAHVPGAIYIKAKEDSGYGEAVRAKEERGEAMTEARTNKEFIAKARQAAELVDPPAAVHGCLDRLEAAEKEIARLRGLIARYHERINGRIPTAIPSFGWGSEHDVWEAVEQIVKEERGIL